MSIPGHADALVVDALGVPVGIPADADHAARLRGQWSRALTDRTAQVEIDLTGLDPADEIATDYAITSRVTLAALAATAGQRLNIHAGAVADAEGRAIAVIGASGSGKTTAITTLARRLGYLSDETVSLEGLVIHPHPKPLSVIEDRSAPQRKSSLSPDDLGLVETPTSARLHRIVVLKRGEGAHRLEPLDAPRAIVEIVAQTSSLVLLDQPIQILADTLDACGGAWSLHYAEIADWIDPLIGLLDREPPLLPRYDHHPYSARHHSVPPGTWQRSEWKDAVQYDDELVLLVGDTAHLLAGLGVVTWLALASPQTTDALVDHAQTVLGEHPDAPTLVHQALEELADRGMLIRPA